MGLCKSCGDSLIRVTNGGSKEKLYGCKTCDNIWISFRGREVIGPHWLKYSETIR